VAANSEDDLRAEIEIEIERPARQDGLLPRPVSRTRSIRNEAGRTLRTFAASSEVVSHKDAADGRGGPSIRLCLAEGRPMSHVGEVVVQPGATYVDNEGAGARIVELAFRTSRTCFSGI
jgi:hypothetical protein